MQNKALRIAIDLTPLRPGGENGGAKTLVVNLLRQFQYLAEHHYFLLLTSSDNHAELSEYQAKNINCQLVLNRSIEQKKNNAVIFINKVKNKITNKLNIVEPEYNILKDNNIDLLFCPFSAPTYAQANVPLVAILYDLQHLDYPFFFSEQERQQRTRFLNKSIATAQKLICISDFTRQSFIDKLSTPAEKLAVVPICIQDRLPTFPEKNTAKCLTKLRIADRQYAFYPANYWQHKNHRFLLVAYGMYKQQFPDRHLDLVFTGALEEEESQLKAAAKLMGLSDNIHFLGFLSDEELAAVWQGSKCLIFPSLYEGFGIPVLEAMRFGKPVLCSDAGSLPEVGADAVLYFNPRKLDEIVLCLARITNDEILVQQLVAKGERRLELFQSEEMARQYLKIFETVASEREKNLQTMVGGVYADGWSAPEFSISVAPGASGRQLVLVVEIPGFYPAAKAKIQLATDRHKARYRCSRASKQEIIWSLADLGEVITIRVTPFFVPSALNLTSDDRRLGLKVLSCQIRSTDGEYSQILELESLV